MITFYHAPNTRSSGILALLEELGAPHDLKILDFKAGEHRGDAFRAINPLGKVPTLTDAGTVITEQVAIMLYLADRFPKAGLAPALDDPTRGRYLRWMVFYAAAFEPALVDRARGHEPGNRAMSPYGDSDEMLAAVRGMIQPGPFILGDQFSAADILWGTALGWTMQYKLVPATDDLAAYVTRVKSRPALQRAAAKDAALAG